MSWISLDNLTRFYMKLKEKVYLKSEVDSKVSDLNAAINGKAASSHTHDDRYFTESEINTKINTLNNSITNASFKAVLLWSNANPSSAFAPQAVTLSLSGYSLVYVICKRNTGNDNLHVHSIFKVGESSQINAMYGAIPISRELTGSSNTYITFGYGVYNNGNDNSYMIPIYIYGIK